MASKIVRLVYAKMSRFEATKVEMASEYLRNSGAIAVPTDTLYGIAAKADDSKALEKIYKIKGRDKSKPLAVCVPNVNCIDEVADISNINMNILKAIFPGPVTVVLKRSKNLNKDLNPDVDTIGVRVPNYSFISAVCDLIGPVALTSANRSGEVSPLDIEDFRSIWDDLDCIFDAGCLKLEQSTDDTLLRQGSTVIDLSRHDRRVYKVIRKGCALNRTINILTRFGYLPEKVPSKTDAGT